MKINDIEVWQPGFILGAKWDRSSSSPALTRIDKDGNTMSTLPYSLDDHPLWGGMHRCTMTAEGLVTYGTNARGDGLTLDGSTGRVMVEIPKFYMKVEHPSANVWEWYMSPASLPGYEIFPAFVQSHDASLKGIIKDNIYVGAYEVVLANDAFPAHTGTTATFHSYTGQQPWTGYSGTRSDGMTQLPYDTGSTEFTIGETLTGGVSGAVGTIVDWIVTGGGWGANNAAGNVWLKQQTAVNYQAEALTGGSGGAANATGVQTNMTLDMSDCRTYSVTNIGGRWGFMNVWTLAAYQMLYIVEYANLYSQSSAYGIGPGVTGLPSGTGFAGKETGVDNADTNVGTNGTGTGDGGTADETPVVYRGIENPWGNTWAYTDGYNAIDASYNIVKADGSGTFADTLLAGNYDASSMTPFNGVDHDVTKLEYDSLMKFFLISDGTFGGSSSTYLTDYFYSHDAGETNILLAGGGWSNDVKAGVACLTLFYVASSSVRNFSSRLEFC
jgi:hypothetical protein